MLCSASDALAHGRRRGGANHPVRTIRRLLVAMVFIILTPAFSWACACGCGVFEVGTASLFPSGSGGTVFLEYNFSDQYTNWHEAHQAPKTNNDDKVIRTQFFTLGVQYMFNRDWGVMVEVPYDERYFKTENDAGTGVQSFEHSALGDIRIEGMYTGFSEDMSTGLRFGVKLASGDFTYPNFDRDTSIGSGSTDLLLGAYHIGKLPFTLWDRSLNWFAQVAWDVPFWTQQQYHPGMEVDGAVGALHDFGAVGPFGDLAPVLNLIGGGRTSDHGAAADSHNSGYDRLLIGPGLEVKVGVIRIYADAEFPIYQNVVGNQLVAPVLAKVILSYDF